MRIPVLQNDFSTIATRAVLIVSGLVFLTASVRAFVPTSEDFELPVEEANEYQNLMPGNDTSSIVDWSSHDIDVAGTGINIIMPVDDINDPDRLPKLNHLAKSFFETTILKSTGQLAAWYADGTLRAVEFDFFSGDPQPKPTTLQRLSVDGNIQVDDGNGNLETVGVVYAYDGAFYAARKTVLEGALGHTLPSLEIRLGSTIETDEVLGWCLRFSGSDNLIHGDVQSSNKVRFSGDLNEFVDPVRHGAGVMDNGENNSFSSVQETAPALSTPPQSAQWFANEATQNGMFFQGNVYLTDDGNGGLETANGTAVSGVIYSTGSIHVSGPGVTTTVTLVAEGNVVLASSNASITAAVGDLLAWSLSTSVTDARVDVSGSGSLLSGCIFGAEEIRFAASETVLTGRLVSRLVCITGDENLFTDGTD